jgi:hypothetical protein
MFSCQADESPKHENSICKEKNMQSTQMNESIGRNRTRLGTRLGTRHFVFFLIFATLTVVYLGQLPTNAVASTTAGTMPGGTIPPGGTLPPPVIDPDQGQVRILHLAPIDADLNNTEVDICTEGGTPVTGLTGLLYGEQSNYVTFAPGTQDWVVGTPGCGTALVDIPPFLLAPGTAITIIIAGDGTNQPVRVVLLVDATGRIYKLYLPIIQR